VFKVEKIAKGRILYYLAGNPFAIRDVEVIYEAVRSGDLDISGTMPAIADFRDVDLLQVPSMDLKNYMFRRGRANNGRKAGPLACLCGDSGSFGMARMYGALGDAWSVRDGSDFYPCYDLEDGLTWLLSKIDLPQVDRASLIADIETARSRVLHVET
jgi:hypothetical protein